MSFVKVRQDGAITIPAGLRRKYSIETGTWYKVSVDGKGRVSLSSQRCVCSLCGAQVVAVDTVTGTCIYCKSALTELVRKGMDLSSALKYMQKRRKNGSF